MLLLVTGPVGFGVHLDKTSSGYPRPKVEVVVSQRFCCTGHDTDSKVDIPRLEWSRDR
jgi:hypothetical protein